MQWHPALNALLNALTGLQLVLGYLAIRRGNREQHKRLMLGAFATSVVFLISYVARTVMTGTHRFWGDGGLKILYLVILFSHMILAAVLVPFVLRTLWLGHKGDFLRHKKIAKLTWPVWIYVSVTGVLVYFMLYQLGPS